MAKRRNKKSNRKIITLLFLLTLGLFGYFAFQKYFKKKAKPIPISELPELPEGFKSYGIDISHHQGEIDWNEFVKQNDSTIRFVYCKVTEGVELVDRQWKRNHTNLYEMKMPHGGYHFFIPSADPTIQANNFISNYNHVENELPPVLDAETEGVTDEKLISDMKIWLKIVENKTGKRPIIYTSYNFYNEIFKHQFDNYKFWIANYSNKSHRFLDEQIIHWQFSESGRIPGIKGSVDLNYSKIEF